MRRADERGVAAVEFAIIVVLFLTLMWGILIYGVLLAMNHNLSYAATEAARAAVGYAETPGSPTREEFAKATAYDLISWGDLRQDYDDSETWMTIDAVQDVCPYDATKQCMTVTIEYGYNDDDDKIVARLLPDAVVPDRLRSVSTVQVVTT